MLHRRPGGRYPGWCRCAPGAGLDAAHLGGDRLVQRAEEARLATLEPLGDEIRREDEHVARLAVHRDLGPVPVGDDRPAEVERVDEVLPEGEPERVDHRVRVVPRVGGLAEPFRVPGRVRRVEHAGVDRRRGIEAGVGRRELDAPDSSNPATTVDLTREGAIVGTVRYMAPEVLEQRGADARSDLFSFGAILYEMITGRRAFEGDSDARAMVSILNEQPKPLRAWRADVPPELQQIVDGCLAKDPEDRWETARDVARQIDAIAPSHTTTPLPISSGTLRLYRTQPRWVAAAVMVGAMGAAGTGVLLTTICRHRHRLAAAAFGCAALSCG